MKDATFGSTADLHYKALYEKTLVENDLLRKQVDELKYPSGKKVRFFICCVFTSR
jgi:hypothetical protein